MLDPEHKASVASALSILQLDPANAPSGSVESLKQRLAKMPRDVVAWKRLADIYQATQAWEPAAQAYETLLRQAPANAQAALNLARLFADHLGRADKALETARTARNLAPTDPEIAHLLGRLAFASGDTTWALSLLEESARRLPQDPSVAYDLGLAKYAAGQVADARTRMEMASRAESFAKRAEATQLLTLMTASADPGTAGQFAAEARTALTQSPKLLPALFVLTLDQQHKGDFAAAAKGYENILTVYPAFSPAARELALLYFEKLNQEPKAAELASRAREAFRDDPRLAKVLGVSAAKKADYSRAASLLKEAAPKLAQDPEVFYYLGLAHFQLKAKSDARQALQKALDLKLSDNLAVEARRLLGEL
jgi:Flp pilus assembly protein TadD